MFLRTYLGEVQIALHVCVNLCQRSRSHLPAAVAENIGVVVLKETECTGAGSAGYRVHGLAWSCECFSCTRTSNSFSVPLGQYPADRVHDFLAVCWTDARSECRSSGTVLPLALGEAAVADGVTATCCGAVLDFL